MHSMKKLAVLAALLVAPLAANARSSYLSSFNSTYGTSGTALDTCNLCHPNGTSSFNAYANDFSAANHAFKAIETVDSDRDGFTNVTEIKALSFPGDAKSVPATTPPPAAPKIAVSSTSLAFGTITVGATGTQTTVVSNSGTADLTVTAARCNGTSAEFTASPASFTVAAGGKATVTVTYAPVDATVDGGCVALANNDSATGTVNVTVGGTGQAATPPPAAVLDVDITRFNVARRLDISRGAVASPTVSVVNAGTKAGTATITVECPAALYSASQTVTLLPGATGKVKLVPDVVAASLAAGEYTFTATVADEDPDTDEAVVVVKVIP
jgi:ASPM-SPD-2-Hydin domain-containing protein